MKNVMKKLKYCKVEYAGPWLSLHILTNVYSFNLQMFFSAIAALYQTMSVGHYNDNTTNIKYSNQYSSKQDIS